MAGDFNVQPNTDSIRALELKLVNIFHDMFNDTIKSTFNIKRKDLVEFPGYASAVVDMMFVTPNIKILDKNVPDVDVSDHLPLVAMLEL